MFCCACHLRFLRREIGSDRLIEERGASFLCGKRSEINHLGAVLGKRRIGRSEEPFHRTRKARRNLNRTTGRQAGKGGIFAR